ncbi:protein kinase [Streptomyces sp. NPDC057654]|uniref:protein kinase n=1 Tax=Streptomyces sp. NPDC057654 TaxID=3346196 RepID=UPI003680F4A3
MNHSLPEPYLWALVRPYTGELTNVQPTARGFGSDVTALVECERGPFFVKAMRNQPGGRRDSIIREKLINPAVRSVSSDLLWHAEDGQWIALGFEAIQGRPSSFKPDSPDLPVIIDILNRTSALDLPEVAQDWADTRWDRFAGNAKAIELLQGNALLHTDINPSNLLIGDQEAWAVDWSWPVRGAAFIDAAWLVVQLISAGHSAESAESWVAGCMPWVAADPRAIDVFAAAAVRMYRFRAERSPDASWLTAMTTAAQSWADHRGVTVG